MNRPAAAMQIIGRRYDTSEPVAVEVRDGVIAAIGAAPPDSVGASGGENLPWIAPGFVDLQVNGYGGDDFTSGALTASQVAAIGKRLDAGGVTAYCPTVTTHSFEVQAHAMRTIAAACRSMPEVACRVAGIHLEGPYISPEDGPRGAHPRAHCRPPDWDEFRRLQDAAEGAIRIVTLAPECDGACDFIARVADSGVLVAIGHTRANSLQIAAAVDAGARMSTHLGNGAHPLIRRHPNYIWDQLADDRLIASLIADGHHLPAAVVKSMVRAKTPSRCVLVSDVTSLAGMPPGRYETGLGAIEVLDDGKLVVAGQRDILAGASLPISYCVANVMRFAGVRLKTAVEMASTRPAQLIGRPPGKLEVGAAANLVLFDIPDESSREPLDVRTTVNSGRVVLGAV